MYVERVKRFSTAIKFLWPIPDRGLEKARLSHQRADAAGMGRIGSADPARLC